MFVGKAGLPERERPVSDTISLTNLLSCCGTVRGADRAAHAELAASLAALVESVVRTRSETAGRNYYPGAEAEEWRHRAVSWGGVEQSAAEKIPPHPAPLEIRHAVVAYNIKPIEDASTREFKAVIGRWYARNTTVPVAPGQHAAPVDGNTALASFQKWNDKYPIMNLDEVLAVAAEHFGIDVDELTLAARYAAAAKQATQGSLTAPPDEAKRLNNSARLWSLTLDLCQRLKVAVQLPPVLKTKQQRDFAGRLSGNFFELNKLEKILFGTPRTPKDPLVSEASGKARAYQRVTPRLKTPTPPRRHDGGESPHLDA